MTTKLIVIDGQIIGTTTPDDPNGYTLIDPPEGFSSELDGLEYDAATHSARYNLSAFQARCIAAIRAQAKEQIEALAWRIERATEHEQLGLPGETVEAVLVEREALRRASNRCTTEVQAADTLDAVRAVRFAVTEADRATPNRITRLQFLSRFTDAEMQAVIAASDQSPALRSALLKWQTADGIVLTQIERQASGFSPRSERTGRDGLLGGKLPSVATTVPNSSFAIRQLEPSTEISGNSPSRMGVREVGALLNESAQADAVGHGRPVEGIPAINGGEDVNDAATVAGVEAL